MAFLEATLLQGNPENCRALRRGIAELMFQINDSGCCAAEDSRWQQWMPGDCLGGHYSNSDEREQGLGHSGSSAGREEWSES